jgi:hypothetical protein
MARLHRALGNEGIRQVEAVARQALISWIDRHQQAQD